MKNMDQSVKDRLKNIAQQTGKDYNFVSIQYMQERFLARLAKSVYRDNFVLKGALLLMAYEIPAVRPSKDIDFLGNHTSNSAGHIRSAISRIGNIDLNDGVIFDPDTLEIQQITEEAQYGGLRVKLWATVAGDRRRLQIDIGFGDHIVDGPVDMDYPSLLEFPAPSIKVYSLESAIAEKFEAIVSLGLLGSRMKDYFDVWFLTQNHEIRPGKLQEAIKTTFNRRNTPLSDTQVIFEEEFKTAGNKQQQWHAFLNRSFIDDDISFEKIMTDIEKYMRSIMD